MYTPLSLESSGPTPERVAAIHLVCGSCHGILRMVGIACADDLPVHLSIYFNWRHDLSQVGSIFEFTNRNAIFGVLPPENPLWAPILLLFAVTGLPSAGAFRC